VPAFTNLFVTLGGNPFLGILMGALVTAVIQSSSASVGILQSLAGAGLIPFNAAIYIIMGQNIGTCVTAMMSSMGAKKNAKTAALMHLLFNIIGTLIFSAAAIAFFTIVNPAWGRGNITQTQISTVHTAFNIATTVLLFPASNLIVKLAKKISGVRDDVQDDSVVSLDDRMLQTPSIALQATISEIGRMGEVVKGTLEVAREVLFTQKSGDIQRLRDDESVVDKFCHGITEYILKISGLQISEKEHTHSARLLQVVNHIERISDYCENISEFAEELKNDKIQFSESGREELQEMIDVCFGSYNYAIEAFIEGDRQKAWKVVEKERKADELEDTLRRKHIKRLTNHQCNTEAGIVFLDMLVCLERISDHARNIAEEVLEHEDY
jgi:phosphate:Na+ symporter